MRNKLLVWDIDGTLVHCGSCGRDALNETFKELFHIENAFENVKIGGAMDSVLLNEVLEKSGISMNYKGEFLQKYGINLKKVLEDYKFNIILPGIKEILNYTHHHKHIYNTIATSNFEIGAKTKLDSHGLNSYFVTGGFGDIEREKWHAVNVAIVQTEKFFNVEFKKEDIYIIGDTWYDIECAQKIGVKSVAVATGWVEYEKLQSYNPDYIFKDLTDYSAFINLL